MSNALLKQLEAERKDVEDYVLRTLENVEDGRDLTEAELRTVEDSKKRIETIDGQIRPLADFLATRNSAIDMQAVLGRAEHYKQAAEKQERGVESQASMSDFVDSEQYRAWNGHGKSGSYEVEDFSARAVLVESQPIGSYLLPANKKYVLDQGTVDRPLLDAVGHLEVSSNSMDIVTYGSPSGATGFAKVAEGASKPEATLVATTKTVNVDVIAAWVQASRMLLQDAPAARGLIDGQLRAGYYTALETEAAAAIAGATLSKVTGASKQSLLEVARVGMATIQAAGFNPRTLMVAPADAAAFDLMLLSKTTLGALANQGVWGLNVVPVAGLTKPLIGDFKVGVQWLERRGVEIFVTDSHADTFVKNVFTILAEGRSAFVVSQPNAIRELAVTP